MSFKIFFNLVKLFAEKIFLTVFKGIIFIYLKQQTFDVKGRKSFLEKKIAKKKFEFLFYLT